LRDYRKGTGRRQRLAARSVAERRHARVSRHLIDFGVDVWGFNPKPEQS
jgi:hypothetical protein